MITADQYPLGRQTAGFVGSDDQETSPVLGLAESGGNSVGRSRLGKLSSQRGRGSATQTMSGSAGIVELDDGSGIVPKLGNLVQAGAMDSAAKTGVLTSKCHDSVPSEV